MVLIEPLGHQATIGSSVENSQTNGSEIGQRADDGFGQDKGLASARSLQRPRLSGWGQTANGGQLNQTALVEFAQQGACGHVFVLTGIGAPIPEGAQTQGELPSGQWRPQLEQSANGDQRLLVYSTALDDKIIQMDLAIQEKNSGDQP